MRIIGGKDYYDHGMGLGYDPEDPVVLVRDKDYNNFFGPDSYKEFPFLREMEKEAGLRINRWATYNSFRVNGKELLINGVSVFFCGKIYQGLRINFYKDDVYDYRKPFKVIWSSEEFYSLLEKKSGSPITDWERGTYSYRDGTIHFLPIEDTFTLHSSIKNYFDSRNPSDELMQFVRDRRLSFITYRPSYNQSGIGDNKNWYLNHDDLGTVEFFKVFDPYQAFQELSMWVGNMPAMSHDMYQLSDKELVIKHGFDKWSFRKMPS